MEMSELDRVFRKGGKIIISTYKKFIEEAGYKNVDYSWIEWKIPCAVAVIKNKKCGNEAKYYIKKCGNVMIWEIKIYEKGDVLCLNVKYIVKCKSGKKTQMERLPF